MSAACSAFRRCPRLYLDIIDHEHLLESRLTSCDQATGQKLVPKLSQWWLHEKQVPLLHLSPVPNAINSGTPVPSDLVRRLERPAQGFGKVPDQ